VLIQVRIIRGETHGNDESSSNKLPGNDFELVYNEVPKPKEIKVLIKVEACGVCH
jgi:Zn-dependent alcohol dehydrogenase